MKARGKSKWLIIWCVVLGGIVSPRSIAAGTARAVESTGTVPSPQQLQWHEMEFYGLIHFGMNTFVNQEWGAGDESPDLFNPTEFDATQIVGSAKAAGMRGLILVCKHHDGFCLWPSKFTEHSVKHSPWRNGNGDVVKEISDACRKQGLKFGVYLSPWDRNHKDFGRPEYVTYYRNLLRELLTNYGDIFIAWFDGAQGGDGYYGGVREKRRVDGRTYYGWPETWSLVRQLQPNAVIFSDAGPDVRWVGNERGIAGDPCWATIDLGGIYPGTSAFQTFNTGSRTGTNWTPAECDVAIRPLWFYHPHEDSKVKSAVDLVNIYYQSVGRGACLDLGLAPDKRGLIPDPDAASLKEMGRMLRETFATNLLTGAKLEASNVRKRDQLTTILPRPRRGGEGRGEGEFQSSAGQVQWDGTSPTARFSPSSLLDGNPDTYWTTDDSIPTPELLVTWKEPVSFNVVSLREYLPLGQRIDSVALDEWHDGRWSEFATATSIGNQRLIRTSRITTTKVRLRVTKASASPALSEFGLYSEPEDWRPKPFHAPGAMVGR